MQTMYYTTRNFIRHESNVVDLGEYRRRLELAHTSLAPDYLEQAEEPQAEIVPLRLVREGEELPPRVRRSEKRARKAWFLDICASLSVLAMTTAFTLTVIFG